MDDQGFGRLKLLIAQGKLQLVEGGTVQATVLDDEPLPNIKRIEPYGFSHKPMPGAQVYLAFPSGDRAQGLALIVGDKQYQMELQDGEVAIHDHQGNYVAIRTGGIVTAKASTKVIADTPLFETTGNAKIAGNLEVAGQTSSTGGYYGKDGGAAEMQGGADVTGRFLVNGVAVDENHTHNSSAPGTPTTKVNS